MTKRPLPMVFVPAPPAPPEPEPEAQIEARVALPVEKRKSRYGRYSAEGWARRQAGWRDPVRRRQLKHEQFLVRILRSKRDKRRAKIAVLFETQDRCLDCGRKMTLQPGRVNQALLHPVVIGRLICQTCKSRTVAPS